MGVRGIAIEALKLPVFTPLARYVYRRFFRRQRKGNHYYGVYPTHADALRAVPTTLHGSYDNEAAAAQYRERATQLTISDYPVLYWLSRLLEEGQRRIFDLGGHVGVAYYAFQRYTPFAADLNWTVSDLPTTMAAGRAWAQTNDPTARLAFTDDKQAADGQDVLLVLGAMQYFDYDFAAWLATLSVPPPHLIISLTLMHAARDFYTLQNMGFACVPYRIHAKSAFTEAMERMGYRVVDAWRSDERDCRIPFHHDHDVEGYSGFYLRRAQ
jgi:putative methyltransferase (TIGR04325 family)